MGRIFFHCSSRFVLTILFCGLCNTWYFLRLCSLKSLSTAETDPRFSTGGGQPQTGGGCANLIFWQNICQKLHENERIMKGEKRCLAPPLDPPLYCFTGKVVFVYLQFIFHPLHVLSFQVHVRWRHRNTSDKLQVCSSRQLSCQIQERLLKVVIALCADIIVLLTQGFKFKEYCYSSQDVVDGHFKI